LELLIGSQIIGVLLDGGQIIGVQVDQILAVGLDAGGSDGLGEDGRATSDWDC
jgi:hypothetical protein